MDTGSRGVMRSATNLTAFHGLDPGFKCWRPGAALDQVSLAQLVPLIVLTTLDLPFLITVPQHFVCNLGSPLHLEKR